MSYKIYELVKPELLKKTELDGYDYKTTELVTLKEVSCVALDWKYESKSKALSDIEENKEQLKHKELVVLKVLTVNWEGEIS